MFVTYIQTDRQTDRHTLWLPESLDLSDRETKNLHVTFDEQEVPATLVEKRAQVVEQFKQLQSGTDSVLKIMTEPEVIFDKACFLSKMQTGL